MDKMILFDLDGTLLPMDQDRFTDYYFGCLAQWMSPYGFESQALIKAVWKGTAAMVKNDGSRSNEAAFWDCFCSLMGEHARADEPLFDAFYHNEFQQVQQVCGFNPKAAQLVRMLKARGVTEAFNLDGGNTLALIFNGRMLNKLATWENRKFVRTVTSLIGIGHTEYPEAAE
jgi:FMN phosphatase YigB (HAD superfamily)